MPKRLDDVQVEDVACIAPMAGSANTSLTQDDIKIALLGNILRCTKPFLKGGAPGSFQKHRLRAAPHLGQEWKVLHRTGPNLDHIRIGRYLLHEARVQHFRDYSKSCQLTDFR